MLAVLASVALPDPIGGYYTPALLNTIPTDAACTVAMLLLALTLVPRASGTRDTPWRARLAVATLVTAVLANLLIVGIIRLFHDFDADPVYQSNGISGATRDAFFSAMAAATLLSEVAIALVLILAAARLVVALIQVVRFLRMNGGAPGGVSVPDSAHASGAA